MLRAHCHRHGRTVLVPTSQIEGIATDAAGHDVRWRCSCGAHQTTRVERRQPVL
jgi:hypothetical protein